MQNLSPKQARFVDEYLVDMNGAAAAERAGYGRVGARAAAHRLLTTNHDIRAAIEARQAHDAKRLGIERQHVIQGLLDAVATAKEIGNAAAMISGWSTIGRMMGFFAPERPKVELARAAGGELHRLETMKDTDLLAIVATQA